MAKIRGDYWFETPERHGYFEAQFFSLASQLAKIQGMSLSQLFSNLKSFSSFKAYLEQIFNIDPSLGNFFEGMSDAEKRDFFNRSGIQNVVERNLREEVAVTKQEQKQIPTFVQQVKGKTREFSNAMVKGSRTRAYKDTIQVKGKEQTVYRDLKGRFARKT